MNTVLNRLTQERWEAITGSFGPYITSEDSTASRELNDRNIIAKVHYSFDHEDRPPEIQDQNARAIAALPRALRALVRAAEQLEPAWNPSESPIVELSRSGCQQASNQIRAALAFASGSDEAGNVVEPANNVANQAARESLLDLLTQALPIVEEAASEPCDKEAGRARTRKLAVQMRAAISMELVHAAQ